MYTTIVDSSSAPMSLSWDEVQAEIENSDRPLSDFTDAAKVLVAMYRNDEWPDRSVHPSPEVMLWGLRAAIGILRDAPEIFERLVHIPRTHNP